MKKENLIPASFINGLLFPCINEDSADLPNPDIDKAAAANELFFIKFRRLFMFLWFYSYLRVSAGLQLAVLHDCTEIVTRTVIMVIIPARTKIKKLK